MGAEQRADVAVVETRRESGAWKTKHARILSAALDEFIGCGFTGASMDRIAQKAKVSKVTIYNHFENKDLLYKQMVEHFLSEIHSGIPTPILSTAGIRDALTDYGLRLVESTTDARTIGMLRLLRAEQYLLGMSGARTESRILPDGLALANFIEREVRKGDLTCDNPLLAARQLNGMLLGCTVDPMLIGHTIDLGRAAVTAMVNSCVDMFLARFAHR